MVETENLRYPYLLAILWTLTTNKAEVNELTLGSCKVITQAIERVSGAE